MSGETLPIGPESRFPFRIEGFEIIQELGFGGFGAVYLARQLAVAKRSVAVKILRHAIPQMSEMFAHEIEVCSNLKHPHIIEIFDAGKTSDGRHFFAMEYFHGNPVDKHVRDRHLDVRGALSLFITLCETVDFVREKGVVHRDLKPKNVLVNDKGNLKVLDFGIAVSIGGPADSSLFGPTERIGSVPYMSPEQTTNPGEELESRTDVYSVGVMLYEVLTGILPYPIVGGDRDEDFRRIREHAPLPLKEAWDPKKGVRGLNSDTKGPPSCPLDDLLERILFKALAKDPLRRYATTGEMGADISHYLRGDPIGSESDSLPHILVSGLQQRARKHPFSTALVFLGIGTLIGALVSDAFFYRLGNVDLHYEKWAAAKLLERVDTERLDEVCLIALQDDTNVAELAAQSSLAGVSDASTQTMPSLRRLHGRLMECLARSRCRAVVWDYMFPSESEFDGDFVRGIAALRKAEIPVVVGVLQWWSGDLGLDALSPSIAVETRWGCIGAHFHSNQPWTIPLLVTKRTGATIGALATEALSAARYPFARPEYLLDLDRGTACFRALESSDRYSALGVDCVSLSSPRVYTETEKPDEKFGLREGDSGGYFDITVPSDSALEAATVRYQDVLHAPDERLYDWFADRVVVIGNVRSGNDRHDYPDGRSLPGLHGHAAAINMLMQCSYGRFPAQVERWFGAFAGAGLAVLLGLYFRCAVTIFVSTMTVLGAIAIGAIAAFYLTHTIINPTGMVAGFAISLFIGQAARRVLGWPAVRLQENK